jgi:hypothetical protein
MAVSVDGMKRFSWPVSTGRRGYGTPSGVFQPTMMARRWYSRKILQFADAARDLLSSRLRHSRDLRSGAARRPRLAWLRPAASVECGDAICPGHAPTRQCPDCDHELRDFNRSITLLHIGEISCARGNKRQFVHAFFGLH